MPRKGRHEKKKNVKVPGAQVADFQLAAKAKALKKCVEQHKVWDEFPVAGLPQNLCVRAVVAKEKGQGERIELFALASDSQNVYRTTERIDGEVADIPPGTPLFAMDEESGQYSWNYGSEPLIPGFNRQPEEKKVGSGGQIALGKDSRSSDAWNDEDYAHTSTSASSFIDATIEALAALLALEKSVVSIPAGIIPVAIADPRTYGPGADVTQHTGWYNTKSRAWMSSPQGGAKHWLPATEPKIGSTAALVVFRDRQKSVVRSTYAKFITEVLDASPVSLDDLEKLIPRDEVQRPLRNAGILMERLKTCKAGQLESGDYIVGLENLYAVCRLRGSDVTIVIPGVVNGDYDKYMPPDGDYVAFRYTAPETSLKDLAQGYSATVTGGTLTIGSAGGTQEIWPKSEARRQALIDSRKPRRLDAAPATNGEWRNDLSAFCAHYGLADARRTGVVVFPMKAAGATEDYPWHITAKASAVRSYLESFDDSQELGDPPSLEDLWKNVSGIHVTVEWYRGAWDNPINPRIFAGTNDWSEVAQPGNQAGGGRETVDPFTGVKGPTEVTKDLNRDYKRFISKNNASKVIRLITTTNIQSET